MHLKTREEIEKAIQESLKKFQVQELLKVTIHENYKEQKARARKEKIAEIHR